MHPTRVHAAGWGVAFKLHPHCGVRLLAAPTNFAFVRFGFSFFSRWRAYRMLELHLARLSVAADHLLSLGFPKV